jgi:alpha-methylacyl-CoA racemase
VRRDKVDAQTPGPLSGVRVIEMAGMGPTPFAAMMLADMRADVVRVDRPPTSSSSPIAPDARSMQLRGRRSICIDLKQPDGIAALLRLVSTADVFLEGFRPGVAERLGFGPTECAAYNPALVYARATGWGQSGELAPTVGHDINYLALSGALYPIGPVDAPPAPPMNYLGDYAGGGLLLAYGIAVALVEKERSGQGQILDAAMLDGISLFTSRIHGERALGTWREARGENTLDGGAPFYRVYETSDHQYVAVGAIERPYYVALLQGLGLSQEDLPDQMDRQAWPELRARFADVFVRRTRAEWCQNFADTDACVTPVLTPGEAPLHPHNQSRSTFVDEWDVVQPAPAPRFSRTPEALSRPPAEPGQHTDEILADIGSTPEQMADLRRSGAVA